MIKEKQTYVTRCTYFFVTVFQLLLSRIQLGETDESFIENSFKDPNNEYHIILDLDTLMKLLNVKKNNKYYLRKKFANADKYEAHIIRDENICLYPPISKNKIKVFEKTYINNTIIKVKFSEDFLQYINIPCITFFKMLAK
ncbi:MAG: hypothetical protein N4A38_00010 [Candidatus Gracilibacteria bacterium]|nr:hypothetical protein [Candidatus Gracilibacteria bacterium]